MINLHFLHGFLGSVTDWDFVVERFPNCVCTTHALETYASFLRVLQIETQTMRSQDSDSNHKSAFASWAENFNKSVFSKPSQMGQKNILIGYSLGGRLALHALQEAKHWDAAILVSTNPGISDDATKQQRLRQDLIWARRFAYEPWENVLHDWNQQSVFAHDTHALQRQEEAYDRSFLSAVMQSFSLGLQKNLRDFIQKINIPTLWLAGEHDEKFVKIVQEMSQLSHNVKHAIIPKSGHRIPWESQDYFAKICNDFLKDLYILKE